MVTRPVNRFITPKARKLIQRLTADRTELCWNSWSDVWTIKGAVVSPAPCRELYNLCLLTTTLKSPPTTFFQLTREARQLLLNPHQKPVILTTKCRQK